MPIYEYGCLDCGHKFEIFASISQHDQGLDLTCPQCDSKQVAQLFSRVGFIKSGSRSADAAFRMAGGCGPKAGPGCCG
jgi:putative FmdB family regulatory protein